jgi:HD-GYP domain-containing protein (c-di-GMP phosphodiesterase class II)
MQNSVVVNVSRLIPGRVLGFPVFDSKGVLLLAAGSMITAEMKYRLTKCGVTRVIMDESDVASTMLSEELAQEAQGIARFEQEITDQLESIVGTGIFRIPNYGEPVQDRMTERGREKYNALLRENFQQQHRAACQNINHMIREALHGGEVSGEAMVAMADACIEQMRADCDCALSVALDANDARSLAEHSIKVALLGMAMGIKLGLDADNVRLIGMTGLVQDWGMALVPKEIREAQRPLTAIEFLEIQKHTMYTAKMLERGRDIPNLVRLVAYQTHERPDGSGYIQGRQRNGIHLFARILNVADGYSAMTSQRPYRPPLSPYGAMKSLLQQAQLMQVDPDVVRQLLNVLSLFPVGSYVALSDGSAAQVLRPSRTDYTRPIVLRLQDSQGCRIAGDDPSAVVDLSQSNLGIVQALPTPGREEVGCEAELVGAGR